MTTSFDRDAFFARAMYSLTVAELEVDQRWSTSSSATVREYMARAKKASLSKDVVMGSPEGGPALSRPRGRGGRQGSGR